MFTESNTEPATVITDIIRKFLSILDIPAYALLGLVYELFFNVASADLFSNETVMKFYSRVQVILGVFMMFHLAMTILRGIVAPDNFFKDSGEGSGSNLIMRIITSLILLTILMPISIPGARNEYERQINNNGLLFGTLYSLQYRILSNNTLGRLILGTNDGDSTFVATDEGEDSELKKAARIFTSTILKGFYRINLVPEEDRDMSYIADGKDAATINENRVCTDIDDDALAAYTRIDANPGDIISMVNLTCDSQAKPGFLNSLWTGFQKLTGTTKYVFTYTPLLSFIVPVVFIFILLSFTIDVAVRAVKLAVLRLIAPIPIISYMDPKGGKDGAFNAWVKTLTSTYLDLFIRLAAVYFVIFLIQDMIVHGLVMDAGSGLLKVFTYIAIWIGLFIFAKQAPKFIKEVLGLKGEVGKLFGGFRNLGGVAAMGAGVLGGGISNAVATRQNGGNLAQSIMAGISGGAMGGWRSGKDWWNNKDATWSNVMTGVRKNNQLNYSHAADDSTFGGRMLAGLQNNAGLQTEADLLDQKVARYQRAEGAWKSVQNALDSDGWVAKDANGNRDAAAHARRGGYVQRGGSLLINGESILEDGKAYSVKELNDTYKRMQSSGRYSQTELQTMDDIVKSAQKQRINYLRKHQGDLQNPQEREVVEGLTQIIETARVYADDPDGVWSEFRNLPSKKEDAVAADSLDNFGATFKGSSFAAGRGATEIKSSGRYAQAKANRDRAAESKK